MHKPATFLLDMDGILFHGDQVIDDAPDFITTIMEYPHLFITNNSSTTPEQILHKLAHMGFHTSDSRKIITSAEATAQWLHKEKPGFRYFAVGGKGLHVALSAVGIKDQEEADYVVIGEGSGLDYQSLTIGINLITGKGAKLIVTNPDQTVYTTQEGKRVILPGGGALVAPFAVSTGTEPVVIGKPQPLIFKMALERLGCKPALCLMIGDRPDTDIAGAAGLGMMSALVRTGGFKPGEPWPAGLTRADWDVTSLTELKEVLKL